MSASTQIASTTASRMGETKLEEAVNRFVAWLERYGETSHDHQSFFASPYGRGAKALYYKQPMLGTLAVAPMIFCEAFVPSARTLFAPRMRFPIADAHYAMGFAFLSRLQDNQKHYQRAVHFLEVLEATRCRKYNDLCWGYPFDWQTRTGTIPAGTPLITSLPYGYEAFREVFSIDGDAKWQSAMRSIARHGATSYRDYETSPRASTCSYSPLPDDQGGVVNASAYRSFLLAQAAVDLGEDHYMKIAERNLNFVLECQNADGSWFYSSDGARDFVDHFHTCFVLKALAKLEPLVSSRACTAAIERGVTYYVNSLFDQDRLPLPFSVRPRMTVYKRELYDYAECINLGTLLRGRFSGLDQTVDRVLVSLSEWQKPDGSFRARKLLAGWDNTPMHRWAQSQLFRSVCFWLYRHSQATETEAMRTVRNA